MDSFKPRKVRSNPIGGPLNSSYNGAVLFLLYKNRTREKIIDYRL